MDISGTRKLKDMNQTGGWLTSSTPRDTKYENDRNGFNGVALDPMRIRTFIINYDKPEKDQKKESD